MAVAILGPVLGAVGNIAGCLIEPIKRELGYMLCFNHNMNELETRLEQLKATKNDVQAREDAEQRSWKTLGEAANLWIVETNGKITEAENVISDKTELQKGCFSIKWCPNLKLRFSLGRKGKKLSLVLDHMLLRGHKLPQTGVALPVPPINMRDYYGDASNFDSRRKPMEDVIELLQDKETKLIGICGMGGIGKTTFAKQVLQKVQDSHKHLFGFQVISTVSSNLNLKTIQQDVVEMLGGVFSLEELKKKDNEISRAEHLRNTFRNKKVVVLLDDVWEEFDLNAIGFPLSNSDVKGCFKIIYTSRRNDLWLRERTITKQNISLHLLSEEEALNLFRKNVCLDDHDDELHLKKEMVLEIVEECGRLPLALEVVGGALFEKRIHEWKDMLFSLRNHHQVPQIDKINRVLETSYDFLRDPNLKLLFLLCCLFQEDQEIPIETLCRYAEGLQLFESINGLKHVRHRVYTLVDDLIRRSLIINVEAMNHRHRKGERGVKMHDVVRDVGLSIGKRHEKGFSSLMCNDETDLKKDISEHTKIISIFFHNRDLIDLALDRLAFGGSNLELLCLDNRDYSRITIPVDFFQMMDNLKVLVIAHIVTEESPLLSFSSYLVKLKMLSLEDLDIDESNLSIIGHLRELEILSFRGSTLKVLPNKISELTNLKLLDLTRCKCFISKGVLSKLSNLQELYMRKSFMHWRVPEQQSSPNSTDEDDNASSAAKLIELSHLNKLLRLELEVYNINQVQRGVKLLSSSKLLEYFKIRIGGESRLRKGRESHTIYFESGDRQLILKNIKDHFSDELGDIMENKITNLCLYNSSGIWENMHVKGFLKDIVLKQCESIITLFEPSQSSPPHISSGLGRPRGDEHKIPEFNSLETLMLDGLRSLESFCKGVNDIHFGKLKRLELKGSKKFIFPTKLRIPCLKELIIESIPNLKSLCNFCAPSLSELTIQNCEDFMYVFSFTSIIMNKNISQISKIHIEGCENLKGIVSLLIDLEEVRNKSVSFPNLQVLYLQFLGNLASFVINENKREKMQNALFYCDQVSLPCLQELFIYDLPKINYIVGWNRSQHYELEKGCNEDIQQTFFPILKEITLHSLTEFMSFVEDVDHDKEDNEEKQNTLSHRQLELPCLEKLNIYSIPNLTNLCNFNFNAPFLKELTIRDCEGLVYLFSATSVMKENISHLSELYVEECKKFKGIIFISTHPLEKRKESFSFPSLQELNLRWLDEFVSFVIVENEEEKMQSAQFYHNQVLFPYLRRLIISGLKKINYIVWLNNQEGEDYNKETLALTFPKLETLYLSHLMELVSFVGVSNDQDNGERQNSILFHPQHQVSFPYLKDLSIQDLPKISYIMGYGNDKHNESKLEPYLPFPILQELCLTDLSNLLHFYESNHPELGMLLFQNLSKLRISSCKKLKYLFSERIVRDACKHLESLDISSCSMLEVVMRKDDDDIIGGGESISLPNNHFFPVLGQLGLQYLKELKRFCDVADTWALSLLKRLNVYSCPKLEALSPGRLNSPKLETFKYNWRQKNTTGDINNILRHLFNRGDDDRDEEWGILAH